MYFDGRCILCNKSMQMLLKKDVKGFFKIGFLNDDVHLKKMDSIVLSYKGVSYTKSTAILKSVYLLGGIYKIIAVLYLIPKPIRDFAYTKIAQNRYKWFGKLEQCPTLPEDWKKRMI